MVSIAVSQEEKTDRQRLPGGTRRATSPLQLPHDPNDNERVQISLVDIRRAYFNATVPEDEPIYVELPPEDKMHGKMCGRLNRHLYGTRRAAAGWEDEYAHTMAEKLGFTRGMASGCLFLHAGRGLRTSGTGTS